MGKDRECDGRGKTRTRHEENKHHCAHTVAELEALSVADPEKDGVIETDAVKVGVTETLVDSVTEGVNVLLAENDGVTLGG